MPSSTVFSYWRRDHRRSTAPPASLPAPSPAPPTAAESPLSPPQLPQLPDTPTFTSAFGGNPSYDAPPWSDSPLENDAAKLNFTSSAAPLSSSVSLAVPSPPADKEGRPHSSPDELVPESTITSQARNSQLDLAGLRADDGDGESNSKPTSPFRLSFGKGLRNMQAPAAESQKRSPTAGLGASQFRLKTSPEEMLVEKPNTLQKDSRQDGSLSRRSADREVSTEHVHHKSGKAMLHLLNPMSLLARRRSSQIGNSRIEDAKLSAPNLIPAIPDDYDPRIRGKIVHDFSAPRARRNLSDNSTTTDGKSPIPPDSTLQSPSSPWNDRPKRHSEYSPVFKEHFEDDENVLHVENKGYLQSTLLTNPSEPGYEKSIPVFARRFPSTAPEHSPDAGDNYANLPAELPGDVPVELPAEVPPDYVTQSPKESPPVNQKEQDIIPKVHPAGLPKHLKSNASSRFSFDMGGVESSVQEKLLEEKHKAKEAARKRDDGYFDDFDDEFDHDMMDDMDDLEEDIPEIGADYDEDYTPTVSRDVNGDLKSWALPALSPVVASPTTPAPPSEFMNNPVGIDPALVMGRNTYFSQEQMDPEPNDVAQNHSFMEDTQQLPDDHMQPVVDDDDMYFDDGEFGDLDADDEDGGFDESIFDDETSHLYERKIVNKEASQEPPPTIPEEDERLENDMPLDEDASQGLKHMPSVASEYQTGPIKRGPLGEPIPNLGPARAHGGVLTEQNLEVLHNALQFAANEAVAQSQFERSFSTSERSVGQESIPQTSQTGDSQPGLASDDSRISQAMDMMGFDDVFEDDIYNDYAYYDDPIVAAANAEALENDDEGFYGQEFGFYAQANGTSELTNGGYFGPRGVEGITRSFSSRGKFQEPSLTPITERSEWSTRNSLISLKAHGAAHSNPSLASPGLAQLVDMGNLDDEMTLSALLKLRRGAWGGSNGSLRSSAGSPPPHTITSSHRGSFAGPSEAASPSEARHYADEGLAGMIDHHDDHVSHTISPLKVTGLAQYADLPHSGIDGPIYADIEEELPNSGTQRLNVL
ncbi:hypothetical protein N7466_004462 [Penicillium verhagenii]|uniref:uncharacterized protein n=1 Tax=Penicillium verhagenii TaxID=1562060 RepID=UPI0025455D1E|nr:uncharacterized protein N7466_004462 [Penicillium verhagenii]KAJ5934915.1 hypothetical protein N7466_004462 [Penicillium verhagenii]